MHSHDIHPFTLMPAYKVSVAWLQGVSFIRLAIPRSSKNKCWRYWGSGLVLPFTFMVISSQFFSENPKQHQIILIYYNLSSNSTE